MTDLVVLLAPPAPQRRRHQLPAFTPNGPWSSPHRTRTTPSRAGRSAQCPRAIGPQFGFATPPSADTAALIFACLGVALALYRRRALRVCALNVASVGASVVKDGDEDAKNS